MKTVGIKVLKNKLSYYLNLVRQGEVVLVSDRDEVIAEIRKPLRVYRADVSRFDAFVEEAANRGVLQKPDAKKIFPAAPSDLIPPPIKVEAADLLDKSREERS